MGTAVAVGAGGGVGTAVAVGASGALEHASTKAISITDRPIRNLNFFLNRRIPICLGIILQSSKLSSTLPKKKPVAQS